MSLDSEVFSEAISENNFPMVIVVQDGCVSEVLIPPSETSVDSSDNDNPSYAIRGVDAALILDCDGVLQSDDVDTATSILCDELGYISLPQIDQDNVTTDFGFDNPEDDSACDE